MTTVGLDEPLRLGPVLVEKVWGGDRLRGFGRQVPDGVRIGESWDVADLTPDETPVPDPTSRVLEGPHEGRALGDLIAADRDALLGASRPGPGGRFPLLVKLLDAGEDLSVQVHPPASLSRHATKTESWVVVDAEPGATMYLGVRAGVTLDEVAAVLGTADLVPLLRRVPVTVGDVVHVPAGVIHALGAGTLVAEVQTSSDTTFRLWDWADRRDGGRTLHLQEGLAAITAAWEGNRTAGVLPAGTDQLDAGPYRLERCHVEDRGLVGPSTGGGRARVLVVLAGTVGWGDGERLGRGRALLLPAASVVPVHAMNGPATVLVATAA